jgi:hypothetical protein
MRSLNCLLIATLYVVLSDVAALPLQKDFNVGDDDIIFPATTTSSDTASSSTATLTTTETMSDLKQTTTSPVSELLNAIFRQTIYSRIESLLLDPGKRSDEKQKIVDDAVSNYHRQKMFGADGGSDDGDDVENVTKDDTDISKSTG